MTGELSLAAPFPYCRSHLSAPCTHLLVIESEVDVPFHYQAFCHQRGQTNSASTQQSVAPFVNDVQLQYINYIHCKCKFMKTVLHLSHTYLSEIFLPVGFNGVMVVIPDLYNSLMRLIRRVVVFISAARPQSQTCLLLTSICYILCKLINMIFANIM